MLKEAEIYEKWCDTYRIMNKASKILGLTSIEFGKNNITKLSKKQYYYNYVLISLFIIDVFYFVIWSTISKFSFSIREISYTFTLMSQSLIALVSIISVAASNRGEIMFKKLIKCDAFLNNVGIEIPYNSTKMVIKISFIISIILGVIFLTTDYLMSVNENNSLLISFMTWFSVKVHVVYSSVVQFQFLFVIGVIGIRFKLINETIINISKQNLTIIDERNFKLSFYEQTLLKKIQIKEKIKIIKYVHDTLVEVCETINKQLSMANLLNLGTNLVALTIEIYSIISSLIDKTEQNAAYNWVDVAHSSYWTLFRTIQVITLVCTCAFTTFQANNIAVPIHKLIESGNAKEAMNDLQNFSIQLLHHKLVFSACGLFPINLSLLYAFIGNISTNLVILVQFKMAGFKVD